MSEDRFLLSVLYNFQMHFLTDKSGFLGSQKHFCHLFQQCDHFIMSINRYFPVKLPSRHSLTVHSEHPDNSKKMINMLMGHKDRSDLFPVNSGIFKLFQNCVSAAAIDHEIFVSFL